MRRARALWLLPAFCAGLAQSAAAGAPSYPEIRMDPRFELFAMVRMLAGAEASEAGFRRHETSYDRAALAHFKRFARHPVVESYSGLSRNGFDYIRAYHFIFGLSDPPALTPREPMPEGLVAKMGGRQSLEEFRGLLADFAQTSGFSGFYESTAAQRRAMIEEVEAQVVALSLKEKLEDYLGEPVRARYTVILSPFVEPALAATVSRRDEDGAERLVSVLGPEEDGGRTRFRFASRIGGFWSEAAFAELASAARPHRAGLESSRALYDPVGSSCAADWQDCARRHVSLAVGARLLDRQGDHVGAAEWPAKYGRIGLPYLGPLVESLKAYESRRKDYPSLRRFYPMLVEVFRELAAQERAPLPFLGGVGDLLSERGPVVVILPGAAEGPASEELRAAVGRLLKKRWPQGRTLSGGQALAADLSRKTLVVIGTPGDNPWLERHFAGLNLPVHLEPGGISLDRRSGEPRASRLRGRLGLVSAALNPSDQSRGLLLFTAYDPQAVAGLLEAYEGPADYAILEGRTPVKEGYYEKSRLPWRVK